MQAHRMVGRSERERECRDSWICGDSPLQSSVRASRSSNLDDMSHFFKIMFW